ncbi:HPr kinase/phosphorylase [Rhizobium halophytocola]|uniref:Serine kinase of HPr protein (Carbohydrate metabolism regulator) n=1 Tax=Rhizobium halophytocola TaxID=735519 RepID=A0ABS4E1K1_9HYPH|nr:HPr kinase/phosphorylase [Rhizobium halophytocola]MBP1851820.1 serine kinase of HPr protein (carbohydrate metabolism regulator) [Rhizobium halophytocola]
MSNGGINLHATVIVAGHRGILFTGPSGSGKSALAFRCLAEASGHGRHAALVADDQVFLQIFERGVIATRPDSIAGLIELRQSAIVKVASQRRCLIDVAVQPVGPDAERLPPADLRFAPGHGIDLPLVVIPRDAVAPLAAIEAILATLAAPLATGSPQF